jgi:phenylacetic acid degradation operon negative regulatory protein
VTDLLSARIEAFRAQRRVQATSLIMTVFGDAVLPRGGRIWLGSLIRLLGPLDLNERLVRTSVFRLVREGWLSTETVGRRSNYALAPAGRRRFEEAAQQIYSSRAPLWDRRWRMIVVVGELDARPRESLRRSLFWQGFGVVGGNCFIHPGADLGEALDTLRADGLGALLPGLMPLVAADFQSAMAASDADLVRRAWDLDALARGYADFIAAYEPILAQLRARPLPDDADERAFLLRILLVHDYRRSLLRDPELPEVLLPADWPGHRARLLCKELYKRLEPASNRHLDLCLRLADDSVPLPDAALHERFPDYDALAT